MICNVFFNGKNLSDFGVYLFSSEVNNLPEKAYREIEIPGHNGAYLDDLGFFRNVEDVIYDAVIVKEQANMLPDVESRYFDLFNYLSTVKGYAKLEDTIHPDEYVMAKARIEAEPEYSPFRDKVKFKLSFSRKPQRYLKMGNIAVKVLPNSSLTFRNPTVQTAKPLIKVTGIGYFTVNGKQYQVTENAGNLIIDSELMDCYEKVNGAWVNRNLNVNMPETFPELVPGENTISTNAVMLEVTPRWWKL